MYRAAGILLLALIALPSCHTARDVAETSAHVATAPARFVGRRIHASDENQNVTDEIYEAPPVQQPPRCSPQPRLPLGDVEGLGKVFDEDLWHVFVIRNS